MFDSVLKKSGYIASHGGRVFDYGLLRERERKTPVQGQI